MVTRMLAPAGEASGSVSAAVKREASIELASQGPRGAWRNDILPKNIAIPERISDPTHRSLSPHFGSIERPFCKTAVCNTTMLAAVALLACAVGRDGERIMAVRTPPAPR